jgi:predicted TIM-barrel fold metal-dependent hydrolase
MVVDQWIDVHAHFSPPISSEESDRRWEARKKTNWAAPRQPDWTVEATLEYMDRVGIAVQMLSNIPKTLPELKASNDYGASLVSRYPARFGLLAALPTDDPAAALEEIERAFKVLKADGIAVTCCYNGIYLGDATLNPVWDDLNRRKGVVFIHPNAAAMGTFGRPSPLLDVAFETTRTVVDMLYAGIFRRYPDIRFVLAHCGAALPALAGRLLLLGTEPWVPNPNQITKDEMKEHLRKFFLDTAASASANSLLPALEMTTCDHIVYGSDCGVPCTSETSAAGNIEALLQFTGLTRDQIEQIGHNALELFPSVASRIGRPARMTA